LIGDLTDLLGWRVFRSRSSYVSRIDLPNPGNRHPREELFPASKVPGGSVPQQLPSPDPNHDTNKICLFHCELADFHRLGSGLLSNENADLPKCSSPKCGRYRLSRRKQIVDEYFASVSGEDEWSPRCNIAPILGKMAPTPRTTGTFNPRNLQFGLKLSF
jgi:hypothetical protein